MVGMFDHVVNGLLFITVFGIASIEIVLANNNTVDGGGMKSSEITNIIIVADAVGILEKFPNPSKNKNNPTYISNADSYIYMIAPRKFVKSGMATSELTTQNMVGDDVRWHITTESNNFDQTAILYDFKFNPEDVFTDLNIGTFTKDCIQPSKKPPLSNDQISTEIRPDCGYTIAAARANKAGSVQYFASFAIFEVTRPSATYELAGYFKWDPYIVVN